MNFIIINPALLLIIAFYINKLMFSFGNNYIVIMNLLVIGKYMYSMVLMNLFVIGKKYICFVFIWPWGVKVERTFDLYLYDLGVWRWNVPLICIYMTLGCEGGTYLWFVFIWPWRCEGGTYLWFVFIWPWGVTFDLYLHDLEVWRWNIPLICIYMTLGCDLWFVFIWPWGVKVGRTFDLYFSCSFIYR